MARTTRRALLLAMPPLLSAAPAARSLAAAPAAQSSAAAPAAGGHDFRFDAIEGGAIDLADWRGKPMLVVNTASFCGYAKQFSALQDLHERYGPRGLLVLAVPSNDFNQENPDANAIKDFCEATWGVQFPMAAPTHVKGPEAHPFFAWAAARSAAPRWNFYKYLVARDGRLLQAFPSSTEPASASMRQAIEAALAAPVPAAPAG